MDGTITIPGPDTIILFGVQVKIFSALFGMLGVVLGHLMAPVASITLGRRRQAAVFAAGVLVSIAITIATGQRPLVVLGWSIGIGFAGITIFQVWAAQTLRVAQSLGDRALNGIAERLSAREDNP